MLKITLPVLLVSALLAGIPSYLSASSSSGVEATGFDALVAGSERIVEAKILDKRTKLNADGTIETTYTLATLVPIKGENANIQEITIPGGEVAGRGLIIPGMPDLQVGDRNILFLSAASEQHAWRMPVGLKAGAIKIESGNANSFDVISLRSSIHSDEVKVDSYESILNEIFAEVERQG
ncbi:MAG: hypothetical protein ACI84O_000620 [Myxococcota bacterium]|jgi:hypothetical protein